MKKRIFVRLHPKPGEWNAKLRREPSKKKGGIHQEKEGEKGGSGVLRNRRWGLLQE